MKTEEFVEMLDKLNRLKNEGLLDEKEYEKQVNKLKKNYLNENNSFSKKSVFDNTNTPKNNTNANSTTTSNAIGSLLTLIIIIIGGIWFFNSDYFKDFMNACGEFFSNLKNSVTAVEYSSKEDELIRMYNVGEKITTDKFEITVTNLEQKTTVGRGFLHKEAGEGNTFICVKVKITNISNEPIGSFSQPRFKLVDGKNTYYSSDSSASSYYANEIDDTSKFWNDLNPGVTIYDSDVFELGKDYYAQNTFDLIIKADKTITLRIK